MLRVLSIVLPWVAGIMIATVITLALITQASKSRTDASSAPDTGLNSVCMVTPDGYTLTVSNPAGSADAEVTGFAVAFLDTGNAETGSDNEPGNGTIDGLLISNLDDWVIPGSSITWNVVISVPAGSVGCELVTWHDGQ